ncbi:pyridoxamine 5'-phosphate oxidase family protein, partial [Streptomyces lavendulocolor]
PDSAPADPRPHCHVGFVAAARAGPREPHTMSLATVGAVGRPDVRTLMLHDADDRGWHIASHATSAKGRQHAAAPHAA